MKSGILLTILLGGALASSTASAAVINFTIHLGDTVPTGLGLSPGMFINGTASYNHSLVPSVGSATLTPVNDGSLTLSFVFAGTTFTQDHDTDIDFPALYFTDGILSGINYFADNHHPASDGVGYIQIETNVTGTAFNYSFDGLSDFTGEVFWPTTPPPASPIPEPSTALLVGLASLISFRRYIRR